MSWNVSIAAHRWRADDAGGRGYVEATTTSDGRGNHSVELTVGTHAISEEPEQTERLPVDVGASLGRWLVAVERYGAAA